MSAPAGFGSSGPSSCQSRKRTKTFTGCWTCRARKIKCDEGRPICQRCRDRQLVCEGYDTRLQWLPPNTLASTDGNGMPGHGPASQVLRRDIPPRPRELALSCDRVGEILRSIDSVESKLDPSSPSEHVESFIENFGVFQVELSHPLHHGSAHAAVLANECRLQHQAAEDLPTSVEPPSASVCAFDMFRSPTHSEAAAAWDLCNLHDQHVVPHQTDRACAIPPANGCSSPAALVLSYNNLDIWAPEPGFTPDPQGWAYEEEDGGGSTDASWRADYNELRRAIEPQIVPGQERFLMEHYRHRVVNLFCVIDNQKSPWKTIHLPRVLQCAGELSFGGPTTRIRNALKYALYSISAFYLSNEHSSASRAVEAERWSNVASRYRCDAIGLLKHAVEVDFYGTRRPRYKEFLATMLSMITINVMSGDTDTCRLHLGGAGRLIGHMSAHKANFSRKAQSLHRIYLYLRAIYEATAPRSRTSSSPRMCSLPSSHVTPTIQGGPPITDFRQRMFHEDLSTPESDGRTFSQEESTDLTDTASYECIYGIPHVLLLMLKETIEVIDMVDTHRQTGSTDLPERLASICDALESRIMDWPLEEQLGKYQNSKDVTTANIIRHQTIAFHNALIIYFSQNVRLLGYRYLRQYVIAILDNIESIERIKAETKILAAPLFWPAFIGATESFEPILQDRFRRWYDVVSLYGLAAVRTGIEVIHEVWERGPVNRRDSKCSWRRVLEDNGQTLMLT